MSACPPARPQVPFSRFAFALIAALGSDFAALSQAPAASPPPAGGHPAPATQPARAGDKDTLEYVLMSTSKGDIVLELDRGNAPVSVANFLSYMDKGFYDGTIFHRVEPASVIQGGGYTADMLPREGVGAPIKSEAGNGLKNKRGTLAMARSGESDSATSQFFINVVDNAAFDPPQGPGYAVFGRVFAGMKVVDEIRLVNTIVKAGQLSVPAEPIVIKSVKRLAAEQAKAAAEAEKPKRRAPPGPLPPSPQPTPPAPQPQPKPQPQPPVPPTPNVDMSNKELAYVLFSTSKGDIVLQLDRAHAPITVANFLNYVDSGFYNGTIFHRVVRRSATAMIDVVQGGGLTADMVEKTAGAPIKNEANNGLQNLRGTISMARRQPPDSATCQFFLNIGDNPTLDTVGNTVGYAVFGRIVAGQSVADAIRNTPVINKPPYTDVPQETVTLQSAKQIALDEAKRRLEAEKAGAANPPIKPPPASPPAAPPATPPAPANKP